MFVFIGKGKRIILLHAMSKDGLLVAKKKDNTLTPSSDNLDELKLSCELIFDELKHDGMSII